LLDLAVAFDLLRGEDGIVVGDCRSRDSGRKQIKQPPEGGRKSLGDGWLLQQQEITPCRDDRI
jgi:hypothetical protein